MNPASPPGWSAEKSISGQVEQIFQKWRDQGKI